MLVLDVGVVGGIDLELRLLCHLGLSDLEQRGT